VEDLTVPQLLGIIGSAGLVLFTIGKILLADWFSKGNKIDELESKLNRKTLELESNLMINTINDLKVQIDGVGAKGRGFEAKLDTHTVKMAELRLALQKTDDRIETLIVKLEALEASMDMKIKFQVSEQLK